MARTADIPVLLMLEDSDEDFFFFERGLKKSGRTAVVHRLTNGLAGLAYLRGEGEFADRSRFPLPTHIVTDIKMPMMNGFEFLRALRELPEAARTCPVALLTNSLDPADFSRAAAEGAACYQKPSSLSDWPPLIGTLLQ
jgi:CheY-like chemotaxis protein